MTNKVKLKTNSGASKRFKIKSNGSIKRYSAFMRHILTKKSTKRKSQLRGYIAKCDYLPLNYYYPIIEDSKCQSEKRRYCEPNIKILSQAKGFRGRKMYLELLNKLS